MSLPNAPRGGGSGRTYTHVPYVRTSKGERWPAWIAGPCQWFACHCSTRTKPCLELLTNGELTCTICSPTKTAQVIGYQPLYRALDGRPVHVIIYELQREVIDKLKLHQAVTVGRHIEATDTVFVTPQLSGGRPYTSTLSERMRPVDMTETLLRMWNLPELTHWYRQTHSNERPKPVAPPSDNVVSIKNRILDGDPRTIADTIELALGPRAGEVQPGQRALDAIKRGEHTAKNGKHPKPSE